MRRDENTHSKGERVKIPFLLHRVGKRSGTMVTKHVDIFVRSYHLIVQRQQNFGYPLSLFRGMSKPESVVNFGIFTISIVKIPQKELFFVINISKVTHHSFIFLLDNISKYNLFFISCFFNS